jgi:hypothetical protein
MYWNTFGYVLVYGIGKNWHSNMNISNWTKTFETQAIGAHLSFRRSDKSDFRIYI